MSRESWLIVAGTYHKYTLEEKKKREGIHFAEMYWTCYFIK